MSSGTFKKPLIIAHRGDTKAGLENTLAAVAAALMLGVDGVEVDLRITRDGRVVLFHDDDLLRLAGRPGSIESLDWTELRKISLTGGFPIPTLEELLDLVKDSVLLNLELKVARPLSGELERRSTEILARFPKARLLLSSFQPLSLWRLRRLAPQIPRGYLFEKHWGLHRMLVPLLQPDAVNAPLNHVNRDLVVRQQRAGRRVFVWTVNNENDMKSCMSLGVDGGVDGLITDEPRKLLELVSHG